MSDDRKDLPPVNSPNFLEKVREALSVYMGNRGDKLDRGVTLRDLSDAGLVTLRAGYTSGVGGKGANPISGTGPDAGGVYEPDLTPPPTPNGFIATAAISNLLVECAAQTYTQGHGHAKSVLYGATWVSGALPVFSDAAVLTEFSGTFFAHATNPATTWHLWLKWVTVDGVFSTSPAGGTNGVVVTTGQNVSTLLTALTGQITAGQLYTDLGSRINLIDGASNLAGSVNARVLAETNARTSGDSANASSISTLSAQVNHATTGLPAAYAAVQTEATTRANADGTLFAQYTVKLDVNGYVSGYGLASTATNAAPTSTFAVRADSFYIASPSGPGVAPTMPFIVRTAQTTINGVVVPVGVYITDAFIQNGTITNAKIGNAAIDDAKVASLSASKLTAGSIAVGQYIQSASYVTGSAGWSINGNGTAEFSDVVVRGAVYASSGTFAGSLSAATGTFAGSLSAATGTFSGILSAATGSFAGNISAATGNFSGTLSGANITGTTGVFSGSLAAGTVDFASSVGVTVTYTAAGRYTLTVPAGMYRMRLALYGGGGGGGGGAVRSGGGGGGGGVANAATTVVAVSPGQQFTMDIGTGGAGGNTYDYPYSYAYPSAGAQTIVHGVIASAGGAGGALGHKDSGTYDNDWWYIGQRGFGPYGGAGGYRNTVPGGTGGSHGSGGGGGAGSAATNHTQQMPSAGGAGGPGWATVEYFDPGGVVLKGPFETLKGELRNQGLTLS